ncbi:MAG TPA: tRNA lysidine(34) synthetase TilS [Cyclobacteriaceae bacterium]|jgi:tRNA(Ile)-lysidine synthase|nr:tRNA lysidine(34) synthetase TilS [Cyclobacteriaceae bacterium]
MVLQQFLNHIDQNSLFKPSERVLLAVSGGLDSMVMLHLFKEAGFSVGVAHCNFQLRGEESNGDEALVNMICAELGVPFYLKRFDTEVYAWERGISIQMAARDLRYNFFEEVMVADNYQWLATAHHGNDSLETVLLNLVRGTGIEGLTGIAVKHDKIIRPLLFTTRASLEEYAILHKLQWREDSSNASDKYHRNLIRNQVIPILKQINVNLEDGFQHTIERLRGTSGLQAMVLRKFKKEAIHEQAGSTYIDSARLKAMPRPAVVLWELLKDKGFNFDQCHDIMDVRHQPGKIFYASNTQLAIDRSHLIISEKQDQEYIEIQIDESQIRATSTHTTLEFQTVKKKDFNMVKDLQLAQLDRDSVTFPLTWRSWKPGDQFVPLGMQHHKKLSDFLIDMKVSIPDKSKVTVLESGGKIIWVTGYRIDDRFKVTDKTERLLIVKKL